MIRATVGICKTYRDAMRLLDGAVNHERTVYGGARYALARMRAFDRAAGAPHRGKNIIHVAGTKGKGTTAHTIEAHLRAAGFRTGLYTSPHVLDLRERIRLDGEMIPRARLAEIVCGLPNRRFRPSDFGILTEAALRAFVDCDWVVLEAGLGGRLDATNIVRPRACVFTPISFDHTDRLGTTVEAIARDKAGIVKRGAVVVAAERHAAFPRRTIVSRSLAKATLRALGLPVRPIGPVRLPARQQRVGRFIVDGCHNAASARFLAARLRGRPPLIFAAAADKDVEAMLAALVPRCGDVYATRFGGGRAMEPAAVASIAERCGARRVTVCRNAGEAIRLAKSGVVAGSFFLAGEALRDILRTPPVENAVG